MEVTYSRNHSGIERGSIRAHRCLCDETASYRSWLNAHQFANPEPMVGTGETGMRQYILANLLILCCSGKSRLTIPPQTHESSYLSPQRLCPQVMEPSSLDFEARMPVDSSVSVRLKKLRLMFQYAEPRWCKRGTDSGHSTRVSCSRMQRPPHVANYDCLLKI